MAIRFSYRKPVGNEGTAGDIVIYQSPDGVYLCAKGKRGWAQTARLQQRVTEIRPSVTPMDSFIMKGNINGYVMSGTGAHDKGIHIDKSNDKVTVLSPEGLQVNHHIIMAKAGYSNIYLSAGKLDYIASGAVGNIDFYTKKDENTSEGMLRLQSSSMDGWDKSGVVIPFLNSLIFSAGEGLSTESGNASDDTLYMVRSGASGLSGNNLEFYNEDKLTLVVGLSTTDTGQINLYETKPVGTHHSIGLKAAAVMAATTVYTLPDAFPTSTSKVLQSTTAGVLSWVSDSTVSNYITNDAADIMAVSDFGANAALKIDADQPATAGAEDSVGLWIDYDRIVAGSGTAAHNDIGIDLDVNTASLGTSRVTGMDIDVVGATSGTHTAIGIDLDVDSADTNIGMIIDTAGTHIKLVANADKDDFATFAVADTGDLTIATIGDGTTDSDLTLDVDGDIELNADGGDIHLKDASQYLLSVASGRFDFFYDNSNYFRVDVAANAVTALSTVDFGGSVGHLSLKPNGSLIFDPDDGKYIAKMNGTEFSAADSAYAGMILGYTCYGADRGDDSYALTTSFVCFQHGGSAAIGVTFITPPSENVEIEVELYYSAGSGAQDLELSISDNATYAGNGLTSPLQFEKSVREPARGHSGTVTQKFLLKEDNLEAIGSSNTIFIAARCDATTGTPIIRWGGDASGDYTNLVMKAVALPATIVAE